MVHKQSEECFTSGSSSTVGCSSTCTNTWRQFLTAAEYLPSQNKDRTNMDRTWVSPCSSCRRPSVCGPSYILSGILCTAAGDASAEISWDPFYQTLTHSARHRRANTQQTAPLFGRASGNLETHRRLEFHFVVSLTPNMDKQKKNNKSFYVISCGGVCVL